MSSDSSSAPIDATLDLAPRASLRALTLLMVLHGSVGLLFMLAGPPQWLLFLLVAAVLVSWLRVRRHPAFGFGAKALTRLTWHGAGVIEKTQMSPALAHGAAGGDWTLHDASGGSCGATLEGDSLVLPGLLVLNFRCDGGVRRTRALLGDELDEEQLRQLRARLRLRAA